MAPRRPPAAARRRTGCLAELAADDGAGFARFYQDSLRQMITRGYLLYGDFRQAEEAAQQALLTAWRQWDRVKLLTADERRQHVMKILISRHADYCRLQPLHASAMTRMLGSHGQMVLDVDRDVLANDVIRAIHDLPAQQRVVALMHWVEKIPVADIAHEMGISGTAARTYLVTAAHGPRRHGDYGAPCRSEPQRQSLWQPSPSRPSRLPCRPSLA